MMTTDRQHRRLTLLTAARTLAHDATAAAGECQLGSRDWNFFHGVETATRHVLHPEMTAVRDDAQWLDAEAPAFRDGFLEASTLLSVTATAEIPPVVLPLPRPR